MDNVSLDRVIVGTSRSREDAGDIPADEKACCQHVARFPCLEPKAYLLTRMISAVIRSRAYPFTSKPSFPGIVSVSTSLPLPLSPSAIYLPLIHAAITPDGLLRCALGAIAIVTELVARVRLTR